MNKYLAIAATLICLTVLAGQTWEDSSHSFNRWPVRDVGGRRYNLTALFPWWTNAAALNRIQDNPSARAKFLREQGLEPTNAIHPRPVNGWIRIIGTSFKPHALGWLVEGEIEDPPGQRHAARFVLEHPPEHDKERFEADYHEWEGLIQFDHVQILTAEYQDVHGNKWGNASGVPAAPGSPLYISGLSAAETRRAQAVYGELQAWPDGPAYRVDFFAAKIGYLKDGSHFEVFDLGMVPSVVEN